MRRALVFVLGSAAVAVTACSAILGFEPLTAYPVEAGAPNESGAPDGPTSGLRDASGDGEGVDGATCATDLTSDARNCGRCGHDCLGAKCEASRCQALKLADGLAIPEGLAVDGDSVFVAEFDLNRIVKFGKNALGACTAAPLPPTCVLTDDQGSVFKPTAMGIDTAHVYWANTGGGFAGEVRSCPLAGCGAQSATFIATLGADAFDHLFGDDVLPLELVVREGLVFWPESTGGAIRSAPALGGGPVTTYLESSSFMPLAIAVDDTRIFFTDDTNQHPTRIQAVPRDGSARDGGAVQLVSDTPARPYGLGLSAAGNLYWTIPEIGQVGDGLVQSTAKTADGGSPIGAIASSQADPGALMVDGANVYWVLTGATDTPTGMVVYCPLEGCPSDGPIILAKDQRQPRHLTQDESAIYWSNEGLALPGAYDGQVWKIAKP